MGIDGTEKLCATLYGEVKARKYVGGSDAPMLHDAAAEIRTLRERLEAVKKQLLKEIHKAPHTWDDAVQVVQEFEGEQ